MYKLLHLYLTENTTELSQFWEIFTESRSTQKFVIEKMYNTLMHLVCVLLHIISHTV